MTGRIDIDQVSEVMRISEYGLRYSTAAPAGRDFRMRLFSINVAWPWAFDDAASVTSNISPAIVM
ncbi:hypothetical protein D3C78_1846700 [compost metagenome]